MKPIDRLNQTIQKRAVGVVGFGKSVGELEKRMWEFRKLDICWASFNHFDIIEDYILRKINKLLDIVFKFTQVLARMDKIVMLPRLMERLEKEKLIVTSRYLLKQGHYNLPYVIKAFEKYKQNVVLLEDIRGNRNNCILNIECSPNNSITHIINVLSLTNTKKIILFGFDGIRKDLNLSGRFADLGMTKDKFDLIRSGVPEFGLKEEYKKKIEEARNSYYRPEIKATRECRVTQYSQAGSFYQNFLNMEKYFKIAYKNFKKDFEIEKTPEIVNCSPNTYYTIFRKINYDELKKEIDE